MAFPPRPSLTVGQQLLSADVQELDDYLVAITPVMSTKASDQSVTSSTTLVNCTGLAVALVASATYRISCELFLTAGSTTPDIKIAATIPSGATGFAYCRGLATAAPDLFQGKYTGANTNFSTTFDLANSSSNLCYSYGATISTTNAGTFQIQFAQLVSDAAATTVKALSNIVATRVA